jgi:colanic acid biosynthesis glycosyl transferase WcaI
VPRPGERWLILTQYYAPELGGPQLRLRAVAKELQRHGIHVEVRTGMPNYPNGVTFPAYRGRVAMSESIDGVQVHRTWLYPSTGRSPLRRIANHVSFTATSLAGTLLGPRPDRLFVESQPLTLGVVALLLRWLRGVPYVYNVPDLQVDVAREAGFLRNRLLLGAMKGLEDISLREAWTVSTVTDRFVEHFRSRGLRRRQISFLPNGADTDFLKPLPPDTELLERWGLQGKKVFTYLGTYAYYHGLETLIEAAALLRDRQDIAFLLIGEGPERARMESLARERNLGNVVFTTARYEEMARVYSITYGALAVLRDLEVARKMRLSKVFPALSCGVPVVFSGPGETGEILEDNRAGVVVSAESPRALALALAALADDPARRDALGRAGRDLVVARFSWRAIVERWLAEIGYPETSGSPS